MSINTKGDNESIALAIKEMKEEGILYKANGKPNIPELMERTGLSRQRTRRVASNGFNLLPHGNSGTVHGIALSAEEAMENTKMEITITTSRKLVPQRGCSRVWARTFSTVSGSFAS